MSLSLVFNLFLLIIISIFDTFSNSNNVIFGPVYQRQRYKHFLIKILIVRLFLIHGHRCYNVT